MKPEVKTIIILSLNLDNLKFLIKMVYLNLNRLFTSVASNGPIQRLISEKLQKEFGDALINNVKNVSFMHNVPKGAETHFEVILVSERFKELSLLKRNRLMNSLLKDEIKKIHSISFKLYEPLEFDENNIPPLPQCAKTKK